MTAGAETTPRKQRGRPFPKGTSGNPHGRPKGSRHKILVALDQIGEEAAAAILRAAIDAAVKGGSTRAMGILLDRVWPARRGRGVPIDIPAIETLSDLVAAFGAVTRAAASGEISPEEASALGSVLEGWRRTVETTEIEARLRALEAERGKP